MYYQGGSEIQATVDLQTLYLMNPNNAQQQHANINNVFLNSATASNTDTVRAFNSHAPLHQSQQFVGMPLSQDAHRPLSFPGQQYEVHVPHDYQAINIIPSFDYNLWRSVDHDDLQNMSLPTPKCLSLSLSSDQTGSNKSSLNDQDFLVQSSIGMVLPRISSGVESKRCKIMGSKYLKAAQQILDEVANVGEGIHTNRSALGSKDKAKIIKASIISGKHIGGAEPEKSTTAQRQEIQMKKAKLVAMLDEVEKRYKNYQQHMHMIVALFEQTAGIGSSKRYTQIASRTISKQFGCLKDAISSQIMASNNILREEEMIFEGPRLEFSVDGFRQQSSWRGQRGLPARAVSVLRAWLFENFLHPYPKDSDKNMMANQTGLTRSQVSNWFINARVRLWKPMVEELYLEEMKNQQQIKYSKLETTAKSIRTNKESRRQKVSAPNQQENNSTTPKVDAFQSKKHDLITNQVFNPSPTGISSSKVGASFAKLIRSINMENNPAQIDPKKPRKENTVTDQDNSPNGDQISETSRGFSSRHGRLGTEQKSRGFHGNSVSLTLALPPSASSHWSPGLSQHQLNLPSNSTLEFGTRILETGIVESGSRVQDSSIRYEILDFQNRNPFPAPHLPDFMS